MPRVCTSQPAKAELQVPESTVSDPTTAREGQRAVARPGQRTMHGDLGSDQ